MVKSAASPLFVCLESSVILLADALDDDDDEACLEEEAWLDGYGTRSDTREANCSRLPSFEAILRMNPGM